MKYLDAKIDKEKIEVVCFSDWHAGSKNFDEKAALKLIEYVNNNDNVYCLSAGDLTNCATKNSKSDVYTSMNPAEEIEYVCSKKLLGSIDKDKWLIMVSGNHGNRTTREVGISTDRLIAKELGVADKFVDHLGLVNIRLSQNSFYTTIHHGAGSGGTFGAKANSLDKLSNIIAGSDICIQGHTHAPMFFLKQQYVLDKKHCRIIDQITYLVNSGTLHTYDNSYAEEKMLKPSCCKQAIITLTSANNTFKKKISIRYEI